MFALYAESVSACVCVNEPVTASAAAGRVFVAMDGKAEAVPGATVEVMNRRADALVGRAVTDEDGSFSMPGLKPGL